MLKSRSLWLIAFLFLAELLVIGLLVPGDWADRVIRQERALMRRQLGEATSQWVLATGNDWYQRWVIDTRADQVVRDFLIPTVEQRTRSEGLENLGVPWFRWVEGRIDATLVVVQQLMMRMALLMVWLPFAPILVAPAVWDGLMTWKIKKTRFDYASPLVHRYSLMGLGLGIGLLGLSLLSPIPIPPMVLPALIFALALLMGLAVSHLQKKF